MPGETAFRRLLVVDLLGGLGDLVMVLPVLHALARRHAPVHVLTHEPGDALLRHDPAVAGVRAARRGGERAAVVDELDRLGPDLVVSTTRYDGIATAIETATWARGARCVTDLWRRPPPDEPVTHRYLRILAEEGLVEAKPSAPVLHLTASERRAGERLLDAPGAPVVLVPSAGMAVKGWPHWRALAAALVDGGTMPLVAGEVPVLQAWRGGPARTLPPLDLRALAAVFAAVGRRGGVVVGPDTGPLRVAAAAGASTVGIFGPTLASRYGLGAPGVDLQGLPSCPHRLPTAIAEQVCWWDAACPLSASGPACMADVGPERVLAAVLAALPSTTTTTITTPDARPRAGADGLTTRGSPIRQAGNVPGRR